MTTLNLFDIDPAEVPQWQPPAHKSHSQRLAEARQRQADQAAALHPGLKAFAFVYTATETGTNTGPRFMMTTPQAMVFCSDERTKGTLHGTRWAFFFTTVWTFLACHWGGNGTPEVDVSNAEDNGSRDALCDELGVQKIPIDQWAQTLAPLRGAYPREASINGYHLTPNREDQDHE